jgi:hypothetical protein
MKKWLKEMIEDKDMWGWLMVFASAPFLFFGMIFQYDFDWSIYVSYVGGALAIVGFLYSAIRSM